ncbi:MAG: deoxyribonuclease IV [Phycisphaerae bacterium]|nr:MAG: deoxyribonuclease IV [Planctomycetota bacterium]KAB2949202.1 MAG: deoxyribonuclease IV [Phycisphaerae bacterium]MBE7458719.1 deoxyribonuclease IV [Planctomycetia bacterium]MCK6466041.1 deoxyribonuclease IV [Phycisphaerae bacterium]MCL4719745.1 deoxyribonuclease IV [Phycisphaerae bacterium]
MARQTPRFGAHLSVAGGLHLAFDAARQARCDALQIFVKNQRQWSAPSLSPDAVRAFREHPEAARITPVIAHASYLLNLASADRGGRAKSLAALTDELQRCEALGLAGLVLHPGSAADSDMSSAIRRIAAALNDVLAAVPDGRCAILLETTAGQGSAVGWRFEHLADILAGVEAGDRVGVCLDTCHLFAAGYDFRSADDYASMITELDRQVGIQRVRCIHVNDSVKPLASRVDRHAHIGEGEIGLAGFRHFVNDSRWAGLPMILETPKGEDDKGRDYDAVNLSRLRRLIRRTQASDA